MCLQLDLGCWTWNKMTQPRPVVRGMKFPHYFSVGWGWQFLTYVENILSFPLPPPSPYRPKDHKSWKQFPTYEGQWGRSLCWGLKTAFKDTFKKHSLNPMLSFGFHIWECKQTTCMPGMHASTSAGHSFCWISQKHQVTVWWQQLKVRGPNLHGSATLSCQTDL